MSSRAASKSILSRIATTIQPPLCKGYIGGEWVSAISNKVSNVLNPATLEEIAQVPDMNDEDTKRAIEAAHAAQASWGKTLAKERSDLLRKMYSTMMEHQRELAQVLSAECGKPIKESEGEIAYGAAFIEWFSEEAKRIYGDTIPQNKHGRRIITIKQPVGVCGFITPWNFPTAMITRKLAPAMAAGCTSVIKTPAETPLSALIIAKIAEHVGVPPGVINVVTCSHENTKNIGNELCANPKVQKISFTGSTKVGSILLKQSADTIKKASMELGGNAPFIVFEDADIDAAVDGLVASKFRNAGQTCVCANRIYVQSSIYDKFADRLKNKMTELKVGDPSDESVAIGPLIHEDAYKKVSSIVEESKQQGATILLGGERETQAGNGYFYKPTILTNVKNSMRCCQEEIFGPVAPLIPFDTYKDAIEMANDTDLGLAAYFYAKDLAKAWDVAEALQAGMVGVNEGLLSTEVAPFGGVKQSGLGREGGNEGIKEFLETKYICLGGVDKHEL